MGTRGLQECELKANASVYGVSSVVFLILPSFTCVGDGTPGLGLHGLVLPNRTL